MSLTASDLTAIRTIIKEEVREEVPKIVREEVPKTVRAEVQKTFREEASKIVRAEMQKVVREEVRQIVYGVVHEELSGLEGKVAALENDVKAIYFILAKIEKNSAIIDKRFQKLSLEDKLLKINAELLEAAKQAGITLPRRN